MQVVVHRPTTTSGWLWIQAELVERGFSLKVRDGEALSSPSLPCWPDSDAADLSQDWRWRPETRDPDHLLTNIAPLASDTRIWWVELTGLSPGHDYTIWYERPRCSRRWWQLARQRVTERGPVAAATFQTLPASLREQPLRVLLASCYCEDRDGPGTPTNSLVEATTTARPPLWAHPLLPLARRMRRAGVAAHSLVRTGPVGGPPADRNAERPRGLVAEAFAQVWNSPRRPQLKFLVGDQVYLDAPIRTVLGPLSQTRMKRHISRTYSRSWEKLDALLAHGGNFFLSDDHEYWNNYPAVPGWPALYSRLARERWELQARHFMAAIQAPVPVLTFDIGNPRELAFCLADTRMHRQRPKRPWSATDKFMTEADLDTLLRWIGDLDVPGVLVLGQPLIAVPRTGLKRVADRGLPDYREQYDRLCNALQNAPHDVLILTGDIHYARYARVELNDRGITLHELVSSPLTLVPGAPGYYHPEPMPAAAFPAVGNTPAGTAHFRNPLAGTSPPNTASRCWPWTGCYPCHDHFMVLGFSSNHEGTVHVDVTAHLVRPDDSPAHPPTPLEPIELR